MDIPDRANTELYTSYVAGNLNGRRKSAAAGYAKIRGALHFDFAANFSAILHIPALHCRRVITWRRQGLRHHKAT